MRAEGAFEIAAPRAVRRESPTSFCAAVRDFAQVIGTGTIDRKSADIALRALEIDELGLDNVDRRMLKKHHQNYGGGPVGLDTLAATIGEEAITLEDVYEPYLMADRFSQSRTPRRISVTLRGLPSFESGTGGRTANAVMHSFPRLYHTRKLGVSFG